MDFTFRIDPDNPAQPHRPASAGEAQQMLESGNRRFAAWASASGSEASRNHIVPISPQEVGLGLPPGASPDQTPFALVLGCADARVPIEMLFGQAYNDLFVVRVAGHVLGDECLGSMDYAVQNLGGSLKILTVLGHSGCGAVTAAVDSYMNLSAYPELANSYAIRSIIDPIFVSVRSAAKSLQRTWGRDVVQQSGYRRALIEMTVCMHAALAAFRMRREIAWNNRTDIEIVYGVFELETRHVRLPLHPLDPDREDAVFLTHAPTSADDFVALGDALACGPLTRELQRA